MKFLLQVYSLVVLVTGGITGLTLWAAPLLWKHGSSAAFNLGVALCIITFFAWCGGVAVLHSAHKGKRP